MRVGFVGLGDLGAPMAHAIVRAGWPLTIYARRPEALVPFAESGAVPVASLRELGAASDLVSIMVVDDAQVEEVALGDGLLAGMRPGSVIAVHSTVHPDTCRRLAAVAAERGVAVLDAPVSGGDGLKALVALGGAEANAEDGGITGVSTKPHRLAVMVGGDQETFERCLPVFESFGEPVRLMGPVGSGQVTKIMNNALNAAHHALIHDAVSLARSYGVDPAELTDMVAASTGASFSLSMYARFVLPAPAGSVPRYSRMMRKDTGLALDVARSAAFDIPSLGPAAERGAALFGK